MLKLGDRLLDMNLWLYPSYSSKHVLLPEAINHFRRIGPQVERSWDKEMVKEIFELLSGQPACSSSEELVISFFGLSGSYELPPVATLGISTMESFRMLKFDAYARELGYYIQRFSIINAQSHGIPYPPTLHPCFYQFPGISSMSCIFPTAREVQVQLDDYSNRCWRLGLHSDETFGNHT